MGTGETGRMPWRGALVGLLALLAACAPASWVPAQEGTVHLPPGFSINTFVSGLGAPRFRSGKHSG